MGSSGKKESKKAYQPPVLIVYGTVHSLTQALGGHGQKDSVGPFARHTAI